MTDSPAGELHSVETLGPAMRARLGELEAEIERGLSAFVEVGRALREIREQRLYLARYDSFDQYVRHRWHMSGTQAHRLVDAAQITDLLGAVKKPLPLPRHEAHVRALAPLKNDPGALRTVWREVNRPGEDVTAEVVVKAVRARLSASKAPPGPETRPNAPEAASGPESEPQVTIHVGVDMDKDQARNALQVLLNLPKPIDPILLTIRAQIESQLATMAHPA